MANAGITFDFAAESAKLRSEIDKVRKEVSSISRVAKGVESGFKMLGGAIVGAFSIGAITSFLSRVNQAADQLDGMSQRLGASAAGLQSLQIAAAQAGGSAEAMQNALAKMSVSLGDALAGNKLVNDSLARLNLSAKELAGLKTDEAFRRISTALAETDNTFERASISQAIFGKGAKDLQEFFAVAPGQIAEVDAALAAAGATLNDIDVAKIGAMNDDLAMQGQIVTNLGVKFLANLSPAVGVATDSFAGLIGNMGGATEAGKTFGTVMVAAIKIIEAAVYGLGAVFESIRYTVAAVLSGITSGASAVVGAIASAAEAVGLDMAVPLRAAADNAARFAESLDSVAVSAKANAQAAAAAAIKAGADVFNAANIFDQAATEFEARAAQAATRAAAAQGAAADPAGAAAQDPTRGYTGLEAAAGVKVEAFDPLSDPKVLQQIQINDAMAAIQDAHDATMIGKLDAFNQTTLGMLLSNADLMQQIEYNKNATLGDAMNSLVGLAIQQGGALGKAGKALAIAQTVWSTGQAIMKAMAEVPWPGNIAAAANIAAMGVAQLANIKRTNIGGASSIAGVKGGGAPVTPALSDNVSATAPAQDMRQSVSQVVIQGNVFSSQETADWIIGQIRDAVNTRDTVFINSNSRQALELLG